MLQRWDREILVGLLRLDLKRYRYRVDRTVSVSWYAAGDAKTELFFSRGRELGKKTPKPQDAWIWSSIICSTTIRAQKGMAE